jgi:hypothetical protein
LPTARAIIKEVAKVTATWQETAKEAGAKAAEITRMASATPDRMESFDRVLLAKTTS